jgi:integrase
MGHQTDTPENSEVTRHTRLERRGSVYYLRAKVPADLRKVKALDGKKELKWSLKTSDPKVAAGMINAESQKANAIFEAERNRINPPAPVTPCRIRHRSHLLKIRSEAHAQELARMWFIRLERESLERYQNTWGEKDRNEQRDVIADLWIQEAALTGDDTDNMEEKDDGHLHIKRFLSENHLTLDAESPEYSLLQGLLCRVAVEHLRRTRDRLEGKSFCCYDPLLRDIFPHTPVKSKIMVKTVEMLCKQFLLDQEKAKLAPKTLFAYQVHTRLLCDIFGKDTPLDEIRRPEVERLCDLLERLPSNATKRYRGKSLLQAIEDADKKGDSNRLAPNTLRNYFFNMFSIFDYAVQTKLLLENPFDDYWLKQRFTPKEEQGDEDENTVEFTAEELTQIFSAPLYTGCQNDERGYRIPGPNIIRRGRFWVPLIGLYQGLRLNEICQLYTQDVKTEEGEIVFEVRVTLETRERASDKRIKRPASKRTVPVHPELLKMGFAEYLEQRRQDTNSPRLFPELPAAKKTGSYSDVFSKWFSNFLVHTLGTKPEATFHSFRHGWRSALRDAGANEEWVKMMGGWARQGQSAKYGRAKHVQILKQEISKAQYPGLNLSHLYTKAHRPVRRLIEWDK